MQFRGEIQNEKLCFPGIQDELWQQRLTTWNGKQIVINLNLWRPAKSHQQVKAIFGLAIAVLVREFDDRGWDTSVLFKLPRSTGIPCSAGDFQRWLYAACPIRDDDDNVITLSKANTEQASKFLDDIQATATTEWCIVIPDPDPAWKEKP